MKLKLSGTGKSQSPRSPGGESVPDEQPTMTSRQVSKDHCTAVQVTGLHQTTSDLAGWLQSLSEGLIKDTTGLAGVYDFTLEYAREVPSLGAGGADASAGCDVPDLYTALQKQLGLQMVKQMLPFSVIVVDFVSADPTAN